MSEHLSREDSIKRIAAIIKDVKFAMLTTQNQEAHLHSRPMTTQQQEFDGDLWFIGSKDSGTVADIRSQPEVNASYSKGGDFVSLAGTAQLVEDRAKLDELWSDFYKAYFEGGKEDPKVQLIKVEAHGAEFWESEGKVSTLFHFAKAAVTGNHSQHGTNEKVSL